MLIREIEGATRHLGAPAPPLILLGAAGARAGTAAAAGAGNEGVKVGGVAVMHCRALGLGPF